MADRLADLALFTLGINTNIRASDLLRITAGEVRTLKSGENFELIKRKTVKRRVVILNSESIRVIRNLLKSMSCQCEDFLFTS